MHDSSVIFLGAWDLEKTSLYFLGDHPLQDVFSPATSLQGNLVPTHSSKVSRGLRVQFPFLYKYLVIFEKNMEGYLSLWVLSTSSTAQGGGGSFKNRKPIGEIGCCESGMAERIHWWTERCLRSPLFLSLWLSTHLPAYLLCIYLSIYLSLSLSSNYLSIHNGVHFFDISTSKSGPNLVCFVHFDLEMCFAPQRRAIFYLSSGQLAPHPPL